MNPDEMLATVRVIKENLIRSFMGEVDGEKVNEYAADFFRAHTPQILDILDDALATHQEPNYNVWTRGDGTNIKISDMTENHLKNTINMLERGKYIYKARYISEMKKQLKKINQ